MAFKSIVVTTVGVVDDGGADVGSETAFVPVAGPSALLFKIFA